MHAKSIKKVTISARIRRADGSVEELGNIATMHKNPILHWIYRQMYTIKGVIKQWQQ